MSDFQKETQKVTEDTMAVLTIIKLMAYPLVFLAGFFLGLFF